MDGSDLTARREGSGEDPQMVTPQGHRGAQRSPRSARPRWAPSFSIRSSFPTPTFPFLINYCIY